MTTQTPDAVREALQGFIADLTGSLRNRDTMLTINHNALRRRIAQGQAALDSRAGDAGEGQEALEQRAVQIITEERGAEWATPKMVRAMIRFRNEAATPAPAVDANKVARLTEALKKAAVDMILTPRNNRHGRADQHIEESRERIRIAISGAPAVDAVPAGEVLPRLTRSMMRAACKAHYGDDNIDGIDLTVNDINYTFAQGFARMWKGIRAALSHGEGRK